jgi:hypothetical protein
MAKSSATAPDAENLLAQLQQRSSMLRSVASLQASHSELQQAGSRGELVCWNACKLHGETGFVRYSPGEPMPRLNAEHVLLKPEVRAVTTKARWAAWNEHKTLSSYLEGTVTVKARLRRARTEHSSATAEIATLEQALATAKAKLRGAEAELSAVQSELAHFVQRAPSPVAA